MRLQTANGNFFSYYNYNKKMMRDSFLGFKAFRFRFIENEKQRIAFYNSITHLLKIYQLKSIS